MLNFYMTQQHLLFSVFFKATALLHSAQDYYLCISVQDTHGKAIAYIEPVFISGSQSKQNIFCSALIPKIEKNWSIFIQLKNGKDFGLIAPKNVAVGKVIADKSWFIASSTEPKKFIKIKDNRFELISKHGSILEYRDKTAFNRYFFIKNIVWMPDNASVLNYLKNHSDRLENVAVLEKPDFERFDSIFKAINKGQKGNNLTDPASFQTEILQSHLILVVNYHLLPLQNFLLRLQQKIHLSL